jgi:hypothetical protein
MIHHPFVERLPKEIVLEHLRGVAEKVALSVRAADE